MTKPSNRPRPNQTPAKEVTDSREFKLVFKLEVTCRENQVPRNRIAKLLHSAYEMAKRGIGGQKFATVITQIVEQIRSWLDQKE